MSDIGQHWGAHGQHLLEGAAHHKQPGASADLQHGHWLNPALARRLRLWACMYCLSLRSTGSVRACPSKPILILCWSVAPVNRHAVLEVKSTDKLPASPAILTCCNYTGKSVAAGFSLGQTRFQPACWIAHFCMKKDDLPSALPCPTWRFICPSMLTRQAWRPRFPLPFYEGRDHLWPHFSISPC